MNSQSGPFSHFDMTPQRETGHIPRWQRSVARQKCDGEPLIEYILESDGVAGGDDLLVLGNAAQLVGRQPRHVAVDTQHRVATASLCVQ